MLRKRWIISLLLVTYMVTAVGCAQKSDKTLTIYFAGDLLLDRGVRRHIEHRGVASLFEGVKPLFLRTDAVVANLECPVTKIHASVNKRYIFRAEPEWLPDLKNAGITHLVLANNHTCDQGRAAITDTRNNLVKNGLIPVGYGRNQEDACAPVIVEKNGNRVAIFSSVLLTLENWAYMADSPGVCQATASEIASRIVAFKRVHGDCRVVVFLHWGAEFQSTNMPDQRLQAQAMVDSGADLVVGCHPHVIQGNTIYKGKHIYYSLGNFVFDQQMPAAIKGQLLKVTFSQNGDQQELQNFTIKDCVPYPD